MKGTLSAAYLERLALLEGSTIARQVEDGAPDTLLSKLPAAWIELLSDPCEATVRELWRPALDHLPRFIDYLAHRVEGAAVVEAHGTVALLLALPDWLEEPMEREAGFCWMGLPAGKERIAGFTDTAGPIPASLDSLWQVSGFLTTRHPSVICSLDPAHYLYAEAPEILEGVTHSAPDAPPLDCLKIAAVNGQMVTCMTRPVGQAHWDDRLVEVFRHTNEYFYGVKSTLDRMLADVWEPSSC